MVKDIMHRNDVWISALLEEVKSYVRMASLAGKEEGRYVPASVAAGSGRGTHDTVRAPTVGPTVGPTASSSSACLVQGGVVRLEQVLNSAEAALQHEEVLGGCVRVFSFKLFDFTSHAAQIFYTLVLE